MLRGFLADSEAGALPVFKNMFIVLSDTQATQTQFQCVFKANSLSVNM